MEKVGEKNLEEATGKPTLPKVSVIIPVYNAGKYLEECLDSVLAQDFTDFELILVDDGSKDSSGEICDRYGEKDRRIRVFHQDNGGVSAARNLGLDNARGEWVYFCDADDQLLPSGLSILMAFAEDTTIDLVEANLEKADKGHVHAATVCPDINYGKVPYLYLLFDSKDGRYHGYTWTKLFKREIIEGFKLRFDESVFYNEDRLFVFRYVSRMEGKVFCSSVPVYRYYVREGSAMQSLDSSSYRRFETDLKAFMQMYKLSLDFGDRKLTQIVKYQTYLSYLANRYLVKKHGAASEKSNLKESIRQVCSRGELLEYAIVFGISRIKHRLFKLLNRNR